MDIVGICDHNSAENVTAAQRCARASSITVLAGIEITTAEEAHMVALFDEAQTALKLQDMVYENLAPGENRESLFGEQIVANEEDEVMGYNKRLLIGATELTLEKWLVHIHELGGLAIASHFDRESYSIIGQLGFIPEGIELDALELSANITLEKAMEKYPSIKNFTLVSASDAHFLQDIGKRTTAFYLAEPTVCEIKQALRKENGRKMVKG